MTHEDDWDEFEDGADGGDDWDESATHTEASKEPAVELDPEDPVEFPDQFYRVQASYEHDGEEIKSGTDIHIKCGNCAAWDAPLKARGNKPLCRPGQPFVLPASEGEEPLKWRMQEDRYSCQTHFIPRDMEDLLSYLTDDLAQVKMLLWSFPAITQLVKLQQRIRTYHEKRGGDPEKSFNTLVDFMLLFNSTQQQDLVRPFIKRVVVGLTASKRNKPKRAKTKFKVGDVVSWEVQPGKRVEGFILRSGGRNKLITIVVAAPHVQVLCPGTTKPVQWQRPLNEWEQMNPRIESSTPTVDSRDG